MSSVRRIAEEAGVSITTVSRALNNDATVHPKTRNLVLTIANRSGYVASVGRRVITNIGFAYTGEPTLAHPYDSAVLAGVARGASECHFDVVVLDMQRDKKPDESYTQFFMRKGVRGVILRTIAESRDTCRSVAEESFPHVVISERYDDPRMSFIDCDSKPDSVRATEYLVALGHRRIAFGMHNVPDRDHVDRLEGYKIALMEAGIEFDPSLVFRHPYTLVGGATIMKMAMSVPDRPTAIYFADPMLGVGAVKQAQELGVRIPDDMSIIGFDDTNVRYSVHPTLTAVCQDASALGFEASLYLTRILAAGSREPLQRTLPTFFEVHSSTGPPPTNGTIPASVRKPNTKGAVPTR